MAGVAVGRTGRRVTVKAMHRVLAGVLFAVLLFVSAEAGLIRVPADQPTIQEGVGAAGSGDTVLVYPGTYRGPLNRDIDFAGVEVVLLSLGGAEVTTIDCERAGRGLHFRSGEGPAAVVDGFTIREGEAEQGGAVRCEGSSPTIRHCIVEANRGNEEGGGIAMYASSSLIEECSFVGNTSEIALYGKGGALFCTDGSAPTVVACVFYGNTSDMGAALACSGASTPFMTGCLVYGNAADSGGAIGCLDWSIAAMEYCTTAGNISVAGTGVFCDGTSVADVASTIIAFGSKGEAVECAPGGAVTLICCDVYQNEYGDWCGCIEEQYGVNGNISEDPLFCGHVDPLKRYMLDAASPCAPGNSPECDGIGAFGVGCGITPVEPVSWGNLKAHFR
jgi:hypothetical protein